ncbi:Putative aminoacrylate hydrolase RutD [Fusarium oxysporum f. sp. cubense race 1]|uniref:Putative aminoacrylate hydrolase RutD n=1 Tax=Fusarium oxysporum f. sp. cubense (strain race 1) TaxID=1229664 RepID=N4USK7_FUSC1|nr:Putative aminoacrylate hydrolase RutD [Fusarium oxysporum f. sp. cubense race 1]
MATLQTVQTQFASVDGVNVAYRRFGKQNTFPLLYVNHLRGSIDVLDPLLFNIIAKIREVILYDSFGIGHSEGAVPDSTTAMASIATKFLAAVGVSKVDVIGFSMGGRVAQIIGDGVVLPPRDVLEGAAGSNDVPPTEQEMHGLFFYPSETSLAAGKDWWKRVHERQVDGEERKGTADAIFAFTVNLNNFDRLKDIKAPTLVTNGHTDVMSPAPNSFILQQKISNAQLIIYPDSGHGHLFQYPELYAQHLELFLNDL